MALAEHAGIDHCRFQKAPTIGFRNAEHVADDRHRQDMREVMDHIHVTTRLKPVEKPTDQRPDAGPQLLDPSGRESLGDQTAQPRVGWRLLHQHGGAQRAKHCFAHHAGAVALLDQSLVPAAEPLVFQDRGACLVSRGKPVSR
jgi:hypothetical protein